MEVDPVMTDYVGYGLLGLARGGEKGRDVFVVYLLLKHVVSLPARDFTVSAVLSLAHVICPSSRGSTGWRGHV